MAEGKLIKHHNLIKWILQTNNSSIIDTTTRSDRFAIRDCECYFLFNNGCKRGRIPLSLEISFGIRLNENKKLNSPVEVTILVSSTSKTFPPERHVIVDERQVKLWSSFEYNIMGSLLTFEMIIYDLVLKEDKEVQTPPYIDVNVQLEAVTKDFSSLLDAGPNHDVEFLCGNETIKAHKDVICCRSTVFASMLGTDMLEGKTGKIKIEDIESSVLRQFLRYLYTGVLRDLTFDSIVCMYQVADKYAVLSLKEQCASFLVENLSHENAFEVLILSDRHNDSDLKNAAMDYMLKEEIPLRGRKWFDFTMKNLLLAHEVLLKKMVYDNQVK